MDNNYSLTRNVFLSLSWPVTVQLFCTHTLYTRIFTALAMSVHNTTCRRGIQAIWQCEEYIQHGTVKIKHVLHTPNIRISLHIHKNCELVWREDVKNLQRRGWAVSPIRSVFPDYGPFTDFFEEIGTDFFCIHFFRRGWGGWQVSPVWQK